MHYKNFTHIPPSNIFELDQTEIEGTGRFYLSPAYNLWIPSVTTVTGFASKEFFKEWAKNPENKKKSKMATTNGQKLHQIVEDYLQNKKDICKKHSLFTVNMFQNLKEYLDKIDNIRLQEQPLHSIVLRMAGRVDCIGEYDGVLSVIDFKTATKTKKEEWIQNYFEQATAYAIMYEELYGEPIKQIVIMITTSEGEIQIFKKKTKDYISPLNETIKNFWKSNQMNTIQEIIKENRK